MKVSNNKDNVDLQSVSRSHKSRRSEAAAEKGRADEAAPASAGRGGAAKVELSGDAKLLSRGIDAAKNAEVTDKDRIAAIKAKIKEGTYSPDYGEVADSMLNEHILNS